VCAHYTSDIVLFDMESPQLKQAHTYQQSNVVVCRYRLSVALQ